MTGSRNKTIKRRVNKKRKQTEEKNNKKNNKRNINNKKKENMDKYLDGTSLGPGVSFSHVIALLLVKVWSVFFFWP